MNNAELELKCFTDLVKDTFPQMGTQRALLAGGVNNPMTPKVRLEARKCIAQGDYTEWREENQDVLDKYPAFFEWCITESEMGAWH